MQYLIGLVIAVAVIVFGIGFMNDSYSRTITAKAQAEATLVRAEAQANLANAQAGEASARSLAIIIFAMSPGIVAVIFGGVVLAVVALRYKAEKNRPPQQITYNQQQYLTHNYYVVPEVRMLGQGAMSYPLLEQRDFEFPLLLAEDNEI